MPPLRQFDQADYQALPLALVGLGVATWEIMVKPELTPTRLAFIGGLVLGAVVASALTNDYGYRPR